VRYSIRSVTTLRADSAGVPREATTMATAVVAVAVERLTAAGADAAGARDTPPHMTEAARSAGIRARGRVTDYIVRADEPLRDSGSPSPESPLSITIEALIDGGMARVTSVPALANECDRPEIAAAALARNLLVRIPVTLAVGDRWTDTTRTFACRGGVPITVTTTVESVVETMTSTTATIRRLLHSRADGSLVSTWRTIGVRGEGTTSETVELAVPSGAVMQLTSLGESTFTLRDSALPGGGAARVVQRTVVEAERLSP
jgi:hypothetical protein